MKPSKTLLSTSNDKLEQLPLPGFKVEVKTDHENWRVFRGVTLSGRVRTEAQKKRTK